MARYNLKQNETNKTENLAGGEAYIESPKLELVSLLLTSFVKDQFYRSSDESLQRLNQLIDAIPDKKFIAKSAIYARNKFGMRSISHVVAGEIARRVKGEPWTKNFFEQVIHRPDDMTEILAYYYAKVGKNEPNALKKGFAKAIAKFDEYQIAKYKKDGSDVSLIDIVNLVHPKNTPAISALIKGTLKAPETWEVKLTQAGQKAENDEDKEALKSQAWEELIKTKKIGYFALLRNLRNILEGAPQVINEALELLCDEKLIANSLVLPFRFVTALEEISKLSGPDARKTIQALNDAVDISCKNVPKFEGSTLVALDTSGSMDGQPRQIGSLFAAILCKSNSADFMHFNSDAWYVNYNPSDSVLSLQQMMNRLDSGGTNMRAVFDEANRAYDRIIILSDMQSWMGYDTPTGELHLYKARFGADPRVYSFDLAGQGTLQFPEKNVFCLAGFSDKTFDIIKLMEQDRNALINEIEKVEI